VVKNNDDNKVYAFNCELDEIDVGDPSFKYCLRIIKTTVPSNIEIMID
jgi:hypothetical protein